MDYKMPPRDKILEALSCVAEGRIKVDGNSATITSSAGDKKYELTYYPQQHRIQSDDPASRFQGYPGYPTIAFLMAKAELPYDQKIAETLAGIKWRQVNDENKKKVGSMYHDLSYDYGKKVAEGKGIKNLDRFVDDVMKKLHDMRLSR